jgi:tetratricopeptide (TPR) repeat protein
MRALKQEGNWNLVVLYAVEWTRKQPGNADAWKELSQGYIKLRQYGEAQDAATRAVQLAPDDFLQWQNLGHINLAIPAPVEALKAFHQAAVLNDHDVVSLVQAGLLNAQLGRLPEAGTAFAKALTVIPQDVQALCGATWVAQREGRVKDAQAMMQQVTSLGEHCGDPGGGASVRVATGESPRVKTTP